MVRVPLQSWNPNRARLGRAICISSLVENMCMARTKIHTPAQKLIFHTVRYGSCSIQTQQLTPEARTQDLE